MVEIQPNPDKHEIKQIGFEPFTVRSGQIESDNSRINNYSQEDLERTRRTLEKERKQEVLTFIGQGGGFVPMHARIDDKGGIHYTPTIAIHGVTHRRPYPYFDYFEVIGDIMRNGLDQKNAPKREKIVDVDTTPFSDLISILKDGFVGNGTLNVVIYPPTDSNFQVPLQFAQTDKALGAKFLVKFHKFYPSLVDKFLHRNLPVFDSFRPFTLNKPGERYVHFVKPEDMSVTVVPSELGLTEAEAKVQKLKYEQLFFNAVGKQIQVEVVTQMQMLEADASR